MPIYAYRCESCGHAQDVLQKMSDALLSVCPACGAPSYVKQLTAAGFQLKGSGWYVTDFKGGNSGAKKDVEAAADKPAEGTSADPKSADSKPVEAKPGDAKAAPAPAAPVAPAPAPATSPAAPSSGT